MRLVFEITSAETIAVVVRCSPRKPIAGVPENQSRERSRVSQKPIAGVPENQSRESKKTNRGIPENQSRVSKETNIFVEKNACVGIGIFTPDRVLYTKSSMLKMYMLGYLAWILMYKHIVYNVSSNVHNLL